MLSFIKKDVLILLRDRTELLILLLMPIILTIILGFALKGLFGGDYSGLDMEVAIVNENNVEADVERFLQDVNQLSVPDQAKQQLNQAVETVEPDAILEDMLQSDQVSDVINLHDMDETEAEQALERENIVAILKVPEDFTYQTLTKMMLDQGPGSELQVIEGKHEALSAGVFHDIVDQFVQTLAMETAIAKASENTDPSTMIESEVNLDELGGKLTATDQEPVTSMEYYTIAMVAMFALFVASTIATKAYIENFQHVFDRILLSGKHPFLYLSGKAVSTATIVFLQALIMFLMARIVLQAFSNKPIDFWIGMLVILFVYSICIGALGALLTSLTLKFNSASVPGIFSGGIVSILSLVGGSFVPVSQMPAVFGELGNWTPNGIVVNALLQWSQGLGIDYVGPLLGYLMLIFMIIFIISLLLFTKRRSA